ncbi:hypothetical protein LTR86_003781 [Recurvomyces mirabilis]|nr:hypothetical protein LTR86_003781 [Recurvomyces mirabilis]
MASQSQAGYPRTSSGLTAPPASQYNMAQQQQQQYSQHTRRTPSNATSSSSTSTNTGLQRAPTNSAYSTSSAPRRSTSSRSTGSSSPTSYVALMRKQKATHEDPRILAAQRAAKTRAAMEVAGGHHNTASSMRTSTSSSGMVGGVRSKIRHHGAPKASTYTGGPNLGGVGVPMRLSASEVDEGDSDEEGNAAQNNRYHSRTGSGRSSLGSGNRGQHGTMHSGRGYSNTSTPSNGHSPVESMGDLAEEDTPMPPDQYGEQGDYFQQSGGQGGSSSSGEETGFGGVGGLPYRTETREQPPNKKTSDELQRRGSVDDRTMTMSAGRLFVANPDLSD